MTQTEIHIKTNSTIDMQPNIFFKDISCFWIEPVQCTSVLLNPNKHVKSGHYRPEMECWLGEHTIVPMRYLLVTIKIKIKTYRQPSF